MKLPKMIIFDYGDTLLCEPDWDSERGNRELLKYATHNPNNCTVEDVQKAAEHIFGFAENVRKAGCDINGQIGNKALYDYLGIKFSLSPLEQETVFWNACSSGTVMPDADKVIDYLNALGIRAAVISNLLWSGEALKERLDRLLPSNKFEFVMTSSDYFIRKPNPVIFDIALQKAGLKADEVWYCGNDFSDDIEGAKGANIFPVWYDRKNENRQAKFEYLHINSWKEFIDVLGKLNNNIDIVRITHGTELWKRTIKYADNCSWIAGKHIAKLLRKNAFTDWEAFFVALDGDNIIGFCSFLKEDYYPENRYSPWISCVFVDEVARGNRVSHRLVEYAEEYARECGFTKVYIASDMVGFYEKCGYTPIDELVNYGGDTDTIFIKELK